MEGMMAGRSKTRPLDFSRSMYIRVRGIKIYNRERDIHWQLCSWLMCSIPWSQQGGTLIPSLMNLNAWYNLWR